MATDMADDDKAVKTEGPAPIEPSEASASGSPLQPGSSTGHPSVWTASDARGPLGTAVDADGRRDDGAPVAGPVEALASVEPVTTHEPATAHEPVTVHEPVLTHEATSDSPQNSVTDDALAPATEERKSRSVLPIAAGLVIGALIGAGSAAIVYYTMGSAQTLDPQVASLSSRLDALEHRPDPEGAVAGLKTSVADLGTKVAALQSRPESSPAAPPASAPSVDLSPLQQKIAALQSNLDALKAQSADTKGLEAKIAALDGDVANAKKETSSTQASLAGVAGDQKLLAAKVMVPALAVVADSLVQQIDQGQPIPRRLTPSQRSAPTP